MDQVLTACCRWLSLVALNPRARSASQPRRLLDSLLHNTASLTAHRLAVVVGAGISVTGHCPRDSCSGSCWRSSLELPICCISDHSNPVCTTGPDSHRQFSSPLGLVDSGMYFAGCLQRLDRTRRWAQSGHSACRGGEADVIPRLCGPCARVGAAEPPNLQGCSFSTSCGQGGSAAPLARVRPP